MKTAKTQTCVSTVEERVLQYIRPGRVKGAEKAPSLPTPSAEAIGFTEGEKRSFNPNICVQYLSRICNFQLLNDETPVLYNYSQGIWQEATESVFGIILTTLMNRAVSGSWRKRFEEDVFLGLKRSAPIRETIKAQEHLVAVQNGVFDVKEKKLKPHSDNYFFRSKSPISYYGDRPCPGFLKALDDIFRGDEPLIQVMQEVFGNCLLDTCKAERAIFWYGTGANGKSVLADILTALIGPDQVSHVQLSSFSDRFGLQAIVNKKVNVSAENEMGVSALNTESIKGIISGDRLNISRKYKEDLSIQPTTKLIFLVNTLPGVTDTSHGFYRKMLILPFQRVFQQHEMDKHLREKLLLELEGILCWALQGAARLYKNQFTFSEASQVQEALESYRLEQNPVPQFLAGQLEYQPEYWSQADKKKRSKIRIDKKQVLNAYRHWLRQQDFSGNGTESPQRFWKLLEQAAAAAGHPTPLTFRKSNGSEYLYGYRLKK